MVRLTALKTFSRLGGRVRRGHEFTTSEDHAAYLVTAGIAMRTPPVTTVEEGPPQIAGDPLPPEHKDHEEPQHVGGGWYEWNGQRYRGRDAALEAQELSVTEG